MRIDGLGSIGSAPARSPMERSAGAPPKPEDLRTVLSAAELDYFAELEKLGPLTYGRRGGRADHAAPAPVLGQRIDVRA